MNYLAPLKDYDNLVYYNINNSKLTQVFIERNEYNINSYIRNKKNIINSSINNSNINGHNVAVIEEYFKKIIKESFEKEKIYINSIEKYKNSTEKKDKIAEIYKRGFSTIENYKDSFKEVSQKDLVELLKGESLETGELEFLDWITSDEFLSFVYMEGTPSVSKLANTKIENQTVAQKLKDNINSRKGTDKQLKKNVIKTDLEETFEKLLINYFNSYGVDSIKGAIQPITELLTKEFQNFINNTKNIRFQNATEKNTLKEINKKILLSQEDEIIPFFKGLTISTIEEENVNKKNNSKKNNSEEKFQYKIKFNLNNSEAEITLQVNQKLGRNLFKERIGNNKDINNIIEVFFSIINDRVEKRSSQSIKEYWRKKQSFLKSSFKKFLKNKINIDQAFGGKSNIIGTIGEYFAEFYIGYTGYEGKTLKSEIQGQSYNNMGQEAHVDIISELEKNKIGYQVKTGKTFKGSFRLYQKKDSLSIFSNAMKRYLPEEVLYSVRYLTANNNFFNNHGIVSDFDERAVHRILRFNIDTFIRYNDNQVSSELSEYKNNFYIINFRMIPSSLIFSYIYLSIFDEIKKEQTLFELDKFFDYYPQNVDTQIKAMNVKNDNGSNILNNFGRVKFNGVLIDLNKWFKG